MMTQYIQSDLTNAYFANISYWKAYIFQIGESVHFGITEVKVEYLRSLLGLWKIFQKFKCNA